MQKFDWDDLQYFLAVAERGTLSGAARLLRTNHVTVSRRVDRLEHALGKKIFERNPRGYLLTVVGERLLLSAKAMAQEADTFRSESRNNAIKIGGVVRLSTLEGFANYFLADRLPQFRRMHPSIGIELITIQQIVSLSRREADMSIALAPPQADYYHREMISPYQLFVYGTQRYLDAAPPIKNRDQLRDHQFIGYISDMIFTPGLDYQSEVAPGVTVGYQCSSLHAQLRAALAGIGLVILPAFISRDYPELVPVLPSKIRIDREYWCVSHKDLSATPRVRLLIDYIKGMAHKERQLFTPL